jgi:hypothetical protein
MATVKISALTALGAMTDASVMPVVSANTTYKLSGTNLTTYMLNKLSVGTPNSPSGSGAISFNNGTGVFTFTPAAGYTLPTASNTTLGGVKVDANTITIDGSGVIKANYTNYSLPIASNTTLGGVKVDANTITIDGSGVIKANYTNYSLPIANASTLGGVKIGSNISVTGDGTISWSQPLQFTNLTDITFNQSPTVTPSGGMLYWNTNQGGIEMNFDGTATGTACQDNFYYVKATGAITKGQLCYFVGTDGASGHIQASSATSGITDGTYIMGIAAENISNGSFGYVQWSGYVTEVNNATYSSGNILYYDPVNGGMTTTFPTSGVIVQVAAVVYAHAIHGIYEVRIVNKQRITGSSGVAVTQAAGSVALTVDSSVVTLTGSQTLTNKTLTAPNINANIDSANSTFTAFNSPTTLNIANGTTSGTVNLASGITASGNTIALNLGANGANGSTTDIVLGSSTSGATSTTIVYGALTVKDVRDTVYTITSGSGTTQGAITPDGANGDLQVLNISGNITNFGFNNPQNGQSITFIITQPSSGGPYTLTANGLKFAGGYKTLSTAASAVDLLTVTYVNSTVGYLASLVTGYA